MGFRLEGKRHKRIRGKNFLSRHSFIPFIFILLLFASPHNANAAEYTQDLNDFINIEVKPWVNSDIVIDNLKKQNEKNSNLSESSLRVLDNNWGAELRKTNQPIISQVMGNELSEFLHKIQTAGKGIYTQITIIDSKGLNISQTIISESYWNLGKPRWDKTFHVKSYSPYISDVYYSDETHKFQVEVSFMIMVDELPAGVVAVGIDVEQLEDWKKKRK